MAEPKQTPKPVKTSEEAEAMLHSSADRSPNAETTARLHSLGDDVTAGARDIDRRADGLTNGP